MTYYYAVEGQPTGPVSEEQLRQMVAQGSLTPQTLVWREGMAEWKPFATAFGEAFESNVVQCSRCGGSFPVSETVQFGNSVVCAGCKPQVIQGLREGATEFGRMEYASMGPRILAKIADGILLYGVNYLLQNVLMGGAVKTLASTPGQQPDFSKLIVFIAIGWSSGIAIQLCYQGFFLHWRGQTPGKMAMKIKVVTADGAPLSWGKCFGRPLAEFLSGCILLIGYIMAFWDPERRALHDRIVGTRVIKAAK